MAGPVRLGVIGCGEIAQVMHLRHAAALRPLFSLDAVCDTDPVVLDGVRRGLGVPAGHLDHRELLATPGLEAVLVLTPGDHGPIVLDALAAGLHVFVEKPLCYRVKDAEAIVAAAETARRAVVTGYVRLFDPGFRRLRETVTGIPGPKLLDATVVLPPDWYYRRHHQVVRPDGWQPPGPREVWGGSWDYFVDEVLLNLAIHEVYCIRALVGGRPKLLAARELLDRRGLHATWAYGDWSVLLTVLTLAELGGGYREELRVVTNDGDYTLTLPSAYLDHCPSELSWTRYEDGGLRTSVQPSSYESVFGLELEHFYRCVREGAGGPMMAAGAALDVGMLHEVQHVVQGNAQTVPAGAA